MLYSVSYASQPQDAKNAQLANAVLYSKSKARILFSMAVKLLSVKNLKRAEVLFSNNGLPARIINPCI